MAESSSQKTLSSEIIPREEPVTLDKSKSPNPFLPAMKLHSSFTRALNEYKEYMSEVWYTTKTLNDSKVWISSPRGGLRGEIGITTFRNALRAQYLPYSRSNSSVLVDTTKSAGDGLKTANTNSGANKESRADDISLKVKLEDLLDILKDTRSSFFTPDSPQGEPIIVSDESEEEEEVARDKDTEATSHDVPKDTSVLPPSSPKSAQIQELMAHIKELKKHVRDIEIEFPVDLKEILTKLETFTSTLSSLSSQVAELKNIHWELPTEFATMVENASGATSMNVPLAGKAIASPAEGEKNIKDADTNLKDELVDLLGKNVVT
ncbi:hypothetical protein Tco_1131424 [Tanacetum coccineum]